MIALGVYRDGTHTCIVVESAAHKVKYIPMDGEGLEVVQTTESKFLHDWAAYPTYPAPRAAEHYLASTHIPRSLAATAALRKLCAKQKNGNLIPPYEVEEVVAGTPRRGVVVADGKEVTIVTTVSDKTIGVLQIPLAQFKKAWQNVHSYSGAQFAEVWLRKHYAKELTITPEAHGHLKAANPQAAEIYEEIEIMASAQTETKPKRQSAPVASKAIPTKGGKATKAVATPAPAKQKAAPAAAAKAPKAAAAPRQSDIAGKKITVVNKAHGAREGSIRAALLDAILKSKTVDAVLGMELSVGDKTPVVTPADVRFAVERGLITLA